MNSNMNRLSFSPFPILNTNRLTLRRLDLSDNQELLFLRTNDKINKFIDRPKPKSIGEVNDFIHKINNGMNNNKWIYWSITLKDNPKLIGTICLWNFSDDNKTAEIGYELNPLFHRKGIMDESLKTIVEYGFKFIGLDSIEAYTHKDNFSSTTLLLNNHFIQVSKRKDKENINNVIFILDKEIYLKY